MKKVLKRDGFSIYQKSNKKNSEKEMAKVHWDIYWVDQEVQEDIEWTDLKICLSLNISKDSAISCINVIGMWL